MSLKQTSAIGNVGVIGSFLSQNIAAKADEEGHGGYDAKDDSGVASGAASGVANVENTAARAGKLDRVVRMMLK